MFLLNQLKVALHGGENGQPGDPGKAGTNGGHFFAVGHTINGLQNLTVKTNGGNGSPGQTAGNGHPGAGGADGNTTNEGIKPRAPARIGIPGGTGLGPWHHRDHWPDWEVVPNGGVPDSNTNLRLSNPGKVGQNGGNGREGGAGGFGGAAGTVELISVSNQSLNHTVSKKDGDRGSDGESGKGGVGGKGGRHWTGVWYFRDNGWNGYHKPRYEGQAADGSQGESPATKNSKDIEPAIVRTSFDSYQQILDYQRYLVGEKNLFATDSMEAFRHQLETHATISGKSNLATFIKECELIEDLFKHAGSRCIPLCRSVLERMTAHAATRPGPAEYVHLQSLCSMVLSKLCQHQVNSDSRLVINIKGFLSGVNGNIAELRSLDRERMIRVYKDEFTSQIKGKIQEGDIYINKLSLDILEGHIEIDKEIKKLLQEVVELTQKGKEVENELKNKKAQLQTAMSTKIFFGAISIVIQAVGCCFSPVGPIVAAIANIGINAIKDASTGVSPLNNIVDGLGNVIDAAQPALEPTPAPAAGSTPAMAHPRATLIRLKDIGKAAQPLLKAGVDILKEGISDADKIKAIDESIKLIEKQKEGLEKYREMISTTFNGAAHDFVDKIVILQKQLKQNSIIHLDFSRLEISRSFENIKRSIREATKEFAAKDGFLDIIRQLEEALDISITIYSRMQDYQDRIELVGYMANIAAPTVGTQDPAIEKLKYKAKRNIILEQYHRAIATVRQWAFPFGDIFLRDFANLEQFERSVSDTDFINHVMAQLASLSAKVNDYENQIQHIMDRVLWNEKFYPGDSVDPFCKWTNQNLIKNLLKGNETLFYADVNNSSPIRSAIKFNKIEIQIKSADKTDEKLQALLDKKLARFKVEMLHSGHSYYRFKQEIYHFTNEGGFVLGYNYEKDKNGQTVGSNDVYEKMKNGNFLLSPYTDWAIKLTPLKGDNDLFDTFKKKLSKIEVLLVGHGKYVKEEQIKTALELRLYEFNKLQSSALGGPLNSLTPLALLAPSSAARIQQTDASEKEKKDQSERSSESSQRWFPKEAPTLDALVVPNLNEPLPPPPRLGIIPNFVNVGNTCWLDSMFNFIACTTYYDQMLTTPLTGEKQVNQRLQGLLRHIISRLRTGQVEQNFVKAFLREFQKQLGSSDNRLVSGVIDDSSQRLSNLTALLAWTPDPNELPKTVETFTLPEIGYKKYPKALPANQIVLIHIPPSGYNASDKNTPLDLNTLLSTPDLGLAYQPDEWPDGTARMNKNFVKVIKLTQLPRVIVVQVARNILVQGALNQETHKVENPIALDADNFVCFNEYPPIPGSNQRELGVARTCRYRITAAIEHIGSSPHGGHYVCWERAVDQQGQFWQIKHDDLASEISRTRLDPHTFGTKGSLLRLERVDD